MAVTGHKIYIVGNIAYIDEIVDSGSAMQFEGLAKNCLPRKKYVDSTEFSFSGFNGLDETKAFPFAQLKDGNGDAWADQATFEAWATSNLGKSSAGDSALTKVLAVFATQSGSDAPTFTYAKNDLGAVPALSYVDVGRFHITKTGAFTEGKTSEFCTLLAIDSNPVCKGFRVSDDVYEIQTGLYGSDLTDSLLNNSFIKIEIFN